MKKIFLFYLFLTSLSSYSQNDSKSKNDIQILNTKAFINYQYIEKGVNTYFSDNYKITDYRQTSFGNVSLACEWSKNNKFTHEIEFMPISINSTDITLRAHYYTSNREDILSGDKITNLTSYLRYQRIYKFFDSNKNFRFTCAFASGIFYKHWSLKPNITSIYDVIDNSFSIPIEIIPGFEIKIKGNLYLALNSPIQINNVVFEIRNVLNPNLSPKLQKTYQLYSVFLPNQFQARIGIFYKIK